MYRVRRDGSGLECLYAQEGGEWIAHETSLGLTLDLVFVLRPKACGLCPVGCRLAACQLT